MENQKQRLLLRDHLKEVLPDIQLLLVFNDAAYRQEVALKYMAETVYGGNLQLAEPFMKSNLHWFGHQSAHDFVAGSPENLYTFCNNMMEMQDYYHSLDGC